MTVIRQYNEGTAEWETIAVGQAGAQGVTGPSGPPGPGQSVGTTPPGSPVEGDQWFNSSLGRQFVYYDGFWVEVGTSTRGEPGIVASASAPASTDVLWLDTDEEADGYYVPAGGASGAVLRKASSTDYDVEWTAIDAIPASTIDALGDIIVGTGNNTAGRLPIGNNGQVLTADSTKSSGVKWASGAIVQPLPAKGTGVNGPYLQYGITAPITATTGQTSRNSADAGSIHVWPFFTERQRTVTNIHQYVHTAQAGVNPIVGVYEAPFWPNMESPGVVLFNLIKSFGTMDCSSTGDKYVANTTTVNGLFFVAIYVPTTASTLRLNQATTINYPSWTNSTNGITHPCFYNNTNYDGGLPDQMLIGARTSNNLLISINCVMEG